MIHWCPEETAAVGLFISSLPFLGIAWRKWMAMFKRKPHCCVPEHKEQDNAQTHRCDSSCV